METERIRLKKQAKRTAILKAALEEFTENGFAKTRLATVAQKAEVAKGTLYLYFASKEELFAGVVEETLSPQEPYGEETSETSLRPEDRLSRFLLDDLVSLRDSGRTGIALVVLTEGHLFPRLVDIYTQAVLTPILNRIMALA
ncbi:MAG: helix-turn-helix domain-containing protein, partial [Rhodospirillaceae bacterium]|nr:helix-turn-helix domain-containing protein [Rhodospirillaceae bacterium]